MAAGSNSPLLNACVVRVSGRQHPVTTLHSAAPVHDIVAAAADTVAQLLDPSSALCAQAAVARIYERCRASVSAGKERGDDILVFLPGKAEIDRTRFALEERLDAAKARERAAAAHRSRAQAYRREVEDGGDDPRGPRDDDAEERARERARDREALRARLAERQREAAQQQVKAEKDAGGGGGREQGRLGRGRGSGTGDDVVVLSSEDEGRSGAPSSGRHSSSGAVGREGRGNVQHSRSRRYSDSDSDLILMEDDKPKTSTSKRGRHHPFPAPAPPPHPAIPPASLRAPASPVPHGSSAAAAAGTGGARAGRAIPEAVDADVVIVALHGSMTPAHQRSALEGPEHTRKPDGTRKRRVVLATNVAETRYVRSPLY